MYPSYVKDAVIDANGFTQIGVDLYNDYIANSVNDNTLSDALNLNIKKVKGGLFYGIQLKN